MIEIEFDLDHGGGMSSSFGIKRHRCKLWYYCSQWLWLSYLNSPKLTVIQYMTLIWIIISLILLFKREGKKTRLIGACACTRPRVLRTCCFSHGFWLKSLRTLLHVFSYHVLSFLFKISALLLNRVRSWKVAKARDPGGLCTLGSEQQKQPPPICSLPLFLLIA